ncbi:MAG: T9SS type A sorting domain-containing protein [Bacteroidota bacterium]
MKYSHLSLLLFLLFFFGSLAAQPFQTGHRTMTFTDPARNNRQIPSEIYYPSTSTGNNTPIANGAFPVIVFGHGFVMPYSAYVYFKDGMVPEGYFVVFPTTEGGILPNHADYGADLAFLVASMQAEGNNPASPFYLHVDTTSAVMGHSMGGGASFLACKNNTLPTVMVTLAAAETNPSAIAAAPFITIPNLVFAADQDCVTPPSTNQIPMYDSLASDCKVFINIKGGGHCYFADYNFQCSLGEGSCQQNFTITRDQQHSTTLDFTKLYLDYYLKKNNNAWLIFNDSLNNSPRISFQKACTTTGIIHNPHPWQVLIYPNPATEILNVRFSGGITDFVTLHIYNLNGTAQMKKTLPLHSANSLAINISQLPEGLYIMEIVDQDHSSFHALFYHNRHIRPQ